MEETSSAQSTRRTAIKSVTGFAALPVLAGTVSGRPDDHVEIPVVMSGDDVVKTTKVPQKWLKYERKVDRQLEKFRSQHRDNSGIISISEGLDSREVAGKRVSNIEVAMKSDASPSAIPQSTDGIPVSVVTEKDESGTDSCNTGDFWPIPGGVQLDEPGGTTTQKVIVNGEQHLLTCAHTFSGSECGETEGTAVQGQNSLGNVSGGITDKNMDIATIPEYNSNRYADYIADDDEPAVNGYVSKIAIKNFKSQGTTMHKMGRKTCHETGTIKNNEYYYTACDEEQPFVRLTTDRDGGDSGAPHYYKFENNGQYFAATIGTHYGWSGDRSLSITCPAWKVYDEHDIQYDLT